MLSAEKINYQKRNRSILSDIDFETSAGQFIAIVGPNGAGKSSLLNILANEIEGKYQISFKGKMLNSWALKELSMHKGKFSQHNSQDIPLEVKEVVMMGRYPYFEAQPTSMDEAAVQRTMLETDIHHMQKREYNTLSGGEKQRVHLARVLAQLENEVEQKILFLDEPLNNLDVKHQHKALQSIKNFCKGGNSAVVVLHDLNLATKFADKIMLLKDGYMLAYGNPWDVFTEKNISKAYDFPCHIQPNPIDQLPMILFG